MGSQPGSETSETTRPERSDGDLPPETANVVDALRTAGLDVEALVLPTSVRTAAEAAEALGCEIGAIANSLVFMADDQPLLVMTSGAHRVDRKKLARRLDRTKIRQATPEQVLEATGQRVGGVSPVGHPAPIETIIDPHLAEYPVIWAAAGIPEAVFSTTYEGLLEATGGKVVEVD